MKKRLAGLVLALAALLGVVASGTSSAQIDGVTRTTATDYGSGLWAGPTTSYVQDAGWVNPNLRVGMVGDSITYRCASQLRTAFAAKGVSFAIRGWAGANTANQNTWLESITYMPDILIGELGTNDVFGPFAMPAQIQRFKNAAGLATEIYWVDTYVARPAYLAHDLRNSGQVNGYIHGAFPDDHVVPWVANLTGAVGRGVSLGTYIDPDGVHPNPAGCAYLAAIVVDTVSSSL